LIKSVQERVWAFDLEWVPDPLAGRLVHGLGDASTSPREMLEAMWRQGGATEEDPTPFLKTVVCRIVSIAAIERRVRGPGEEPTLALLSLPRDPTSADDSRETAVVGTFLEALGKHKPQLVGFNSRESDLKILIQRGVILGVEAAGFAQRPEKPWLGIDYFARDSEWSVDLKDIVGGWGKGVPSLHELAVQCGVPGKMDVDGNDVAELWLSGRLDEIVAYNELDALTTYLVWLRIAHFAGLFSTPAYEAEQARVRDLILRESAGGKKPHLLRYLDEWQRLGGEIARR
jgi:predicted PolB exonuclease-like 3'-5' exonuclease